MQFTRTAALAVATALAATSAAAFIDLASPASAAHPRHVAAPQQLVIGTDLPLQGSLAESSADVNRMLELYLDDINHRVGKYRVTFRAYDDSSAAAGQWTDQACAANARAHLRNAPEVAVLGTLNSGCAANELPTLNNASDGAMRRLREASPARQPGARAQ